MLNRLQAASRLLIRSSLAVFTAVVLLLIQSAFWSNRVSAWMQAIIFATALLSYFRPQYGLLALAALAPLGQVGSRTLESQMRGAESLVLAFLAGTLVRGWTLRQFRTFPSTHLDVAALIFGFVVAASCIEQIWFSQIQIDFASVYAGDFLSYASRTYITSAQGYGLLFRTMLLLEGLALLVITARFIRVDPGFAHRLVVMFVVGASVTALITLWYVAAELRHSGPATAKLVHFFAARWTVHVSDVNAAGSFFAMGMFVALGMAVRGAHRWKWIAAGIILAGTTWMTRSRTAIAAVILIVVCLAAAATVGRLIGVRKAIVATGLAIIACAIAAWHYLGPEYFGSGALMAVRVRWLFLGVTWRMLLAEPVFGIGIGQFFLWSHHFATSEMFQYYQRENAHNNFAQIAGELGIIGLIGFLVVLALSLWRRDAEQSHLRAPLLIGLAAFILTWLGGHPLLVAEVAYPFWIVLGVCAAFVATNTRPASAAVVAVFFVFLLVSIPFRVAGKAAQLDLPRVTYGLSPKREMVSRARFFVPEGGSRVDIPLRARYASDREPVEVDVFVDGVASEMITLTDRNWRRTPVVLSRDASRRFHQIDLRIRPDTLNNINPGRSSVEVGKWEIISKPNG